ncbi:hypothetical protein HDU99_002095, partial [Rhizoclosmatium hyalinum]
AKDRYKNYSICAKTIYIEWFLEQYRDAPSETAHRKGAEDNNPQGSKHAALKLGHSYVGNVLGQLSQILADNPDGIGCSKGNQCKMHHKIISNEKVESKSRSRKVNADRQDNIKFHMEKLISFKIRKIAKLFHLACPRHKGHCGLRDLNMACLNEVSCERSVEMCHLEYLDLAVRQINLAEDGHICAELGINDCRYIIVGQHWYPIFDFGFTHALSEFEDQHMYGVETKVTELLKGYKAAAKLKVYDAGSVFDAMSAKTHSRSVDEMQKSVGIKINGKGTRLVQKQGPYLLEKANVGRDGIKSVGWLVGQGEGGAFDKGYFKNFHQSAATSADFEVGEITCQLVLRKRVEESGRKRKERGNNIQEELERQTKRRADDDSEESESVSEGQEVGVEVSESESCVEDDTDTYQVQENKPSVENKADNEMDWDEDSVFADNGSGVVGHRKYGKTSLIE